MFLQIEYLEIQVLKKSYSRSKRMAYNFDFILKWILTLGQLIFKTKAQ
jgi:hypothetical protein